MSSNLKDLLACMESCSACGQCEAACPVYMQSGIAIDSPRGKLRIALGLAQGRLRQEEGLEAITRCMLCGRCSRACPQNLPLERIFIAARRFLEPHLPAWRRNLVWAMTKAPKVWDFCQPPLNLLQRLRPGKLPQLAFSPFASQEHEKGAVLLFGGCLSRRFFPEVIPASIKAMERHGYTVIWEPGLVCCGRPQALQGRDISGAVRRNLQAISKYEFASLTSPCPGCMATIGGLWPGLSGLKPEEKSLCEEISAKSVDISLLLVRAGARGIPRRAFWHSPCLLSADADSAARELAGADAASSRKPACCGAPLELLRTKPERSANRLDRLLRSAKLPLREKLKGGILGQAADAEYIATACPGCMIGLAGRLPVRHVMNIYAQELD